MPMPTVRKSYTDWLALRLVVRVVLLLINPRRLP